MHNQKGISTLIGIVIVIAVAIVVVGGVFGYQYLTQPKEDNQPQDQQTACTMEAKICPDGSAVGRSGPNCEFAECPAVQDQTASWKTYTSTKYGFEFKYPKDYKTQGIPTDNPTGLNISLDRGNIFVHEIDNSIININLPEDCMFSSSQLEDKNMLSYVSTKEINGISFYYYINYKTQANYLGAYCGMSTGCQRLDVYRTLYKGKCFEIKYQRSDRVFTSGDIDYRGATQEEMKVPEIFNEILSTFKFTK